MWAGYPGAPVPALRGVDLSLAAGRRVAVVGPSGAGKSTLAAVLVRFLPCQAGSITLDGSPLERLAGDDLRTVVGLVGQDAYLFDATIAENLRVGKRDATDDELRDVLERVGLAGWLDDLPEGWRPRWDGTGPGSRAASASGWRWPGPCSPTSRCWSSTSPPSISIRRPPTPSPPTCST